MPPRFKFTKQEIVQAALEIVRESGIRALTARSLASRLDCSVKPIFGLFENMEQVQTAVIEAAYGIYNSYLEKDMLEGKYPPYKASGMAYIRFAGEQKELFKLLFMRDRTDERIDDGREELRPIIDIIKQNLSIDDDRAYMLHLEMWIFVHGIASMIATNYLNWDINLVSDALTDAYRGLAFRFTEGA